MAESRSKARKRAKPTPNVVTLKSGLSVGAAAAEDDDKLLFECFEDSGAYEAIRTLDSPRFLIKGRTGAGKSALLRKLERDADNVIRIDPKHLCLQHISNSDIIRFLHANEVRIEPFLEVIWKHTFATELLRRKLGITSALSATNVLTSLLNSVHPSRRRAVEYLRDFGLDLWPEFDERVTAVTKKVEDDIRAELSLGEGNGLRIGGGQSVSEEERREIQRRIQRVLGSQQLSRLQSVIDFMAEEVFTDLRKPTYVIVDDLDQFYVDDAVRMQLLRALIDVVKKFRPIAAVKFCVAMRSDLLEEIFEKTKDRGFQAEKYEDNIIAIRWSSDQLFKLIEKRISTLFRQQYTRQNVRFYDLFSESVRQTPTREYLLSRTLMRPRDAILFVNECLSRAVSQPKITPKFVAEAEAPYSFGRLDSLAAEWMSLYPLVRKYVAPLRGRSSHFAASEFSDEEMLNLAYAVSITKESDCDRLGRIALRMLGDQQDRFDAHVFRAEWLRHLYVVGVVGIKTESFRSTQWSYKDKQDVPAEEIVSTARIEVHKMFRVAVGTKASED